MTVDHPLKPKVLSALVAPNFTRIVALPLETDVGAVDEVVTARLKLVVLVIPPPVPVTVIV